MAWWRQKPLSLPLLCKTVLHPQLAIKIGRMEKIGISLKILSQKALFHSPEGQRKVEGWQRTSVWTIPSLGSRGHLWSTAALKGAALQMVTASALPFAGKALLLPPSPLSACRKGIYPPGKALPEDKRTQIPFCGCPQLRSFIVQPSDSSAWLTKGCLAWLLMSNNVFFQLLSLW